MKNKYIQAHLIARGKELAKYTAKTINPQMRELMCLMFDAGFSEAIFSLVPDNEVEVLEYLNFCRGFHSNPNQSN